MPDASALSVIERERLAKLCGMLASSFDGERANAARMATELLQRHGLTWRDLVTPEPADARGRIHGTGDQAGFASRHMNVLTPWEQEFIRSVRGRQNLSVKQRATLAEIVAKVRVAT